MENNEQKAITDREILEISLMIERDGKAFYQKLADHVEKEDIKSFLLSMVKEEALHEIQLRKLFLDKGEKLYGWENQKELNKFIAEQFQADIFPDLDEILDPANQFDSLQKAIEFAIEAEKISKEFYALLGEYCDDFKAKVVLVMLEKAETQHLEKIMEMRDKFLNK